VRHETALAKVGAVVSHVEAMIEGGVGKVVVWAHHRDVISQIAERFRGRAACLSGETPLPKRDLEIQRFQKDLSCQVFVGSILAGGQGITLTAAANEVFAELDWTPGNLSQAEDRCHRIGQRESLLIQHVVVDGSLDARMAKLLVEKQHLIENVLGTKGSEAMGDGFEESALDAALSTLDLAA
jgi:SWI/SNF-related matrix-associated actin-dependent regulator 1 of chromatin subfamily A